MGRYRPPSPPRSNYITPEGAATLRAELDFLWRTKRPAVTRSVAEAAAQGDRSENAEYIYGKKQLSEIDRRVRYLRKRLDGLHIIDQVPNNTTKIFFGAWFQVKTKDGDYQTFRIVGPAPPKCRPCSKAASQLRACRNGPVFLPLLPSFPPVVGFEISTHS